MSDFKSGTFLGTINPKGVTETNGIHNGFGDLYIDGSMLNCKAQQTLNEEVIAKVEGVQQVIVRPADSIIRVAVATKSDGSYMSSDEIEFVLRAFSRALASWAAKLSAKDVLNFIEAVEPSPIPEDRNSSAMVVYGDPGGR